MCHPERHCCHSERSSCHPERSEGPYVYLQKDSSGFALLSDRAGFFELCFFGEIYRYNGGISSPSFSSKPNIMFMFCTAWPDAPFTRLSITEHTNYPSCPLVNRQTYIAKIGPPNLAVVGITPSFITRKIFVLIVPDVQLTQPFGIHALLSFRKR